MVICVVALACISPARTALVRLAANHFSTPYTRQNNIDGILSTKCTDPRPEICTMDYQPVCAVQTDGIAKTYSACSETTVIGYNKTKCVTEN